MHCREVAAEVIRTLDERSQQIILLRFFEEKSHEEIAEILNLNTGNVRVIQSRALTDGSIFECPSCRYKKYTVYIEKYRRKFLSVFFMCFKCVMIYKILCEDES